MSRVLGSVLLIAGGLALGLVPVREQARQARTLALWGDALLLLEGELSYALPAMPQLLAGLAHRLPPPVGTALGAVEAGLERLDEYSFSQIWERAIREHSGLRGEGQAPLRPLGEALSRYERAERDRALETARERLRRQELLCREEVGRKGRAYGVLGATLGAFAVILLI